MNGARALNGGCMRRLLCLSLVALGLVALPADAWAQFPGGNGVIAFGALTGTHAGIATIQAPGDDPIFVTQGRRFDRDPSYSPDGSRITFVGGTNIWVMNADGSDAKATHAWSHHGGMSVMVARRLDDRLRPGRGPVDHRRRRPRPPAHRAHRGRRVLPVVVSGRLGDRVRAGRATRPELRHRADGTRRFRPSTAHI